MPASVINAFPARNGHIGNRRRIDRGAKRLFGRLNVVRGGVAGDFIGHGNRLVRADVRRIERGGFHRDRNVVAARLIGQLARSHRSGRIAVVRLVGGGRAADRQPERRDSAGHRQRFDFVVGRGETNLNRVIADVFGGRNGAVPGLAAVGRVFDGRHRTVNRDQLLLLTVIDVSQAVDAVSLIFERAVVVRRADRAGVPRQVGRRIARRLGNAGGVDRHRAVGEGVLRLDVVAARKEGLPGLVDGAVVEVKVGRNRIRGIMRQSRFVKRLCVVEFTILHNRFEKDRAVDPVIGVRVAVKVVPFGRGVTRDGRPRHVQRGTVVEIDPAALAVRRIAGDQRLIDRMRRAVFGVDPTAVAAGGAVPGNPAVVERQAVVPHINRAAAVRRVVRQRAVGDGQIDVTKPEGAAVPRRGIGIENAVGHGTGVFHSVEIDRAAVAAGRLVFGKSAATDLDRRGTAAGREAHRAPFVGARVLVKDRIFNHDRRRRHRVNRRAVSVWSHVFREGTVADRESDSLDEDRAARRVGVSGPAIPVEFGTVDRYRIGITRVNSGPRFGGIRRERAAGDRGGKALHPNRAGIAGKLAVIDRDGLTAVGQPAENVDRASAAGDRVVPENQVIKLDVRGLGHGEYAERGAVERDMVRLIGVVGAADHQAVVVVGAAEIKTTVKPHCAERVLERDRLVRGVFPVGDRAVGIVCHRAVGLIVDRQRLAERNQPVVGVDDVQIGRHAHTRIFRSGNFRLIGDAFRRDRVVDRVGAGKGEGHVDVVRARLVGRERAGRVDRDGVAVEFAGPVVGNLSVGRAVEPLVGNRGIGNGDRQRRDFADDAHDFGIVVDVSVPDVDWIGAGVAVGQGVGPVHAVGGILRRNDGSVELDQVLRLPVIRNGQADDPVPRIFIRAVIGRRADRAGHVRQVFPRLGIQAGTVDRDRTVGKGVLRFDIASAEEERVAGLENIAVGVRGEGAAIRNDRFVEGIDVVQAGAGGHQFGIENDRVGRGNRCAGVVVHAKVAPIHAAVPGNG